MPAKISYKNLDLWKRSVALSCELYRETTDCKDFGFRNQLTRSGLSIPSNVAEGQARLSDRETIRFLSIAKGSAAELETQILIGRDIGYIATEHANRWLEWVDDIQAMLTGLIKRYQLQIGDSTSH